MFKSIRIGSPKSARTVVGVFSKTRTLPGALRDMDRKAGGAIREALRTPGFQAEAGEVIPAGKTHLLLGLGKKDELTLKTLRMIGARLVKALDRMGITGVVLALDGALPGSLGSPDACMQAVAEGMGLANWRVDFFDGTASKTPAPKPALSINTQTRAGRDGLARGLALAKSTNYARRIAATPPNTCHPTFMAREARRLARETGLSCRVISFTEAKKLGMGGLVNVGKASAHKPCLIQLEHRPRRVARRARGKTIALVGKTITYDTGGYSLKINNTMKGMKYDKNGGMAVLGAMHAIATLSPPVHVVGLLTTAENMVSGDSYRPDDIITMYNGVSVEVTNTDAEGRLVLADALAYACKKFRPAALVDVATLTGGVVVALGSWCAGIFCNDDSLRNRLERAADATDERLWRLPLWEDHRDFMRSRHADIWNSGPKRDGHPLQGAAFLSFFVDDDIPWAHLDIAGVSAVDSDADLYVQGPTGFGVRLLAEFIDSFT